MIFVSMNYRLGVFGFLTLGDESLPGNLGLISFLASYIFTWKQSYEMWIFHTGLWDQLGSLKWVKRNIAAFGGDLNKITIFGESAGGWSISYHLASQQSKDHFSAAIVQSGSLDMAMLNNEKIKALPGLHQKYVNQLDCPVNTADMSTTIECLQHKSVDEIMESSDLFSQCNSMYLYG